MVHPATTPKTVGPPQPKIFHICGINILTVSHSSTIFIILIDVVGWRVIGADARRRHPYLYWVEIGSF